MKPVGNSPQFTNALVDSKSLYLRQHAHNPVMWYPWSGEAMELARRTDRPILVSIGYSSCYWCHVMEREVFENPSIAAFMNEHFINIKVDREEYPDIDEAFMVARQLMTREGGWPNNVFLTPDLKPFYAGGTFGAKDMGDRPAFPRVLEWLNYLWMEKRGETLNTADEIFRVTQDYLKAGKQKQRGETVQSEGLVALLIEELIAKHDDIAGGFYTQPKFPHESYLDFLTTAGQVLNYKPAIDVAVHSALHMAAGGIYDQVACGFHRYAVDKHWYIPHFEKMLYNQALLASVYTDLYDLTQNPNLGNVAEGTLEFVSGPMTSKDGGFFTAIDAETEGVEGAYYAWEAKELERILDKEELAFFVHYFALADIPHFPGHKKVNGQVIVARKPLWDAAKEDNLPYIQVSALAGQVFNKLLAVRNQRPAPALDDKIIAGWNGLMIAAYAKASVVFDSPKFLRIAEKAADFIVSRVVKDDGFIRRIIGDSSPFPAPLEDYSYLAHGLIELHRANPNGGWLDKAEKLLLAADVIFYNTETHSYRLNYNFENMPQIEHISDSAIPSPSALMLDNWLEYYKIKPSDALYSRLKNMFAAQLGVVRTAAIVEHATFIKALLKFELVKNSDAFIQRVLGLLDGSAEPAKPVVKITAAFVDGEQNATRRKMLIDIDVADGWYIQPNVAFGNVPTEIAIQGDNIERVISMEYPIAQKLDIEGHKVSGFAGKQQIKAEIGYIPEKTRKEITVTLTYQACKAGVCSPKSRAVYRL